MTHYTVSQLAKIAGVSVRTLHHYDQIELLQPSSRTAAGYRLYGEADLLRLQQILFFRELEFSLSDIAGILDDPGFDPVDALEGHRRLLQKQAERIDRLLETIDNTLLKLMMEDSMPLTDEELYEGFSKEEIEEIKQEVQERYDPKIVAESNRRVRNMSKAQWEAVGAQGDAATRRLAELMGRNPADAEVQAAIAAHHAWIENFYTCPAEMYSGLGQMYASDPRFRAHYDAFRTDLADFMAAAMAYYAEHTLS